MNCQNCNENPATVHVVSVPKGALAQAAPGQAFEHQEQRFCDTCAKVLKYPIQTGGNQKSLLNIVQLLKHSTKQAREASTIACPECGITLNEFRTKGRLGCPNDYEVFAPHLENLLRRVHNATRHVGRVPGIDDDTLKRKSRLTDLRARLEEAIREEQYENAAQLRDQIASIEGE